MCVDVRNLSKAPKMIYILYYIGYIIKIISKF